MSASKRGAPVPSMTVALRMTRSWAWVMGVGKSGRRARLILVGRPVELDPRRRVVARLRQRAHPGVHARFHEMRSERLREQQVVDAQARVALPVLAEVIPERED